MFLDEISPAIIFSMRICPSNCFLTNSLSNGSFSTNSSSVFGASGRPANCLSIFSSNAFMSPSSIL